jgi:outer membrane protein insertion porin family
VRVLLAFIRVVSVCTGLRGRRQIRRPAPAAAPAARFTGWARITIKFVGTANINEQVVRANMADCAKVATSTRSCSIATSARSTAPASSSSSRSNSEQAAGNVQPRFRGDTQVSCPGGPVRGGEGLQGPPPDQGSQVKPNQALDERQIKEDAQKLRVLPEGGYNQAQVNYTIDRDRQGGFGTVIFKIREGAKVKIAEINFVGNKSVTPRKLRGVMETKKWWMFSWLTGGRPAQGRPVRGGPRQAARLLPSRAYLDVEIPQDKVTFNYPKRRTPRHHDPHQRRSPIQDRRDQLQGEQALLGHCAPAPGRAPAEDWP